MTVRFDSVRVAGGIRAGSAVAGAAGWALFLGIFAADCAMEGFALRETAAVAPAGRLSPELSSQAIGRDGRSIMVLIRAAGPVDHRELGALRAAGVEVSGVAGNVVTGRVAKRRLEAVAALKFVRYLEPERRLSPQKEKQP